MELGGGVSISYTHRKSTNPSYQLELLYSNITKCSSNQRGGGVQFRSLYAARVLFSHLVLSRNSAKNQGGGIEMYASALTLIIRSCVFYHGVAQHDAGAVHLVVGKNSAITIQDTLLLENSAQYTSELYAICSEYGVSFFLLNTTIEHTIDSKQGVLKISKCDLVFVKKSNVQISNQSFGGLIFEKVSILKISNSAFKENTNVFSVLIILQSTQTSVLRNCSFLNNSGHSAIIIFQSLYMFNV